MGWIASEGLPRFLFPCLLIVLFGCSSNPPKNPEEHARFERIVGAVESLRKAYVEKDEAAVEELLLPLERLERLEEEIRKDFSTFSMISLNLFIERINITGDLITVSIRWQGKWRRSPEEIGVEGRGHGILLWSGTKVILLTGLEGDLPFGMATRRAMS